MLLLLLLLLLKLLFKKPTQNHRQKEEEAHEHFSGSHGIVSSKKGVGGRRTSTRLTALGQTDRRTEEQQPSKGRNSGRCSLDTRRCWRWRTRPIAGQVQGVSAWAGTRAAGSGGGRGSRVTFLHHSQLRGAAGARPFPAHLVLGAHSSSGLVALQFRFISLPAGWEGWGAKASLDDDL